jgi:hypothetical protein
VPRIKRISVIRFHTRGKAEPTFTIHLIPQTSLRFLRNLEHARYGRGADLGRGRADARGSRNNSKCGLGVRVGLTSWTGKTSPNQFHSFYFAFLLWVSMCSRHIATVDTAARPSQGKRSRKVTIIVPLS